MAKKIYDFNEEEQEDTDVEETTPTEEKISSYKKKYVIVAVRPDFIYASEDGLSLIKIPVEEGKIYKNGDTIEF